MKPLELKQNFIQLRAEGRSFRYIAKALNIAKDTCSKWEADLATEIDTEKRARLAELYQGYCMTKEARIRRLGDTLNQVNAALSQVDFTKIDPVKLLDYQLRYTEALKGECISDKPGIQPGDEIQPRAITAAFIDLFNQLKDGDISADQAQKECLVLANLLKSYESTEIKWQLDGLEAAIRGRQ